jgi:hypothetical protein
LLSADRLKAFAFTSDSRNVSANYDDDADGELLTIKAQRQEHEIDPQEQTIRPLPRKSSKTEEHMRSHQRGKSSVSKAASAAAAKPKSPTKSHFGSKFELPARPDLLYREQSVEDYSDLFVDNDNVFDKRINNLVLKKVWRFLRSIGKPSVAHIMIREMLHSCSTHQTSRAYLAPCNHLSVGA